MLMYEHNALTDWQPVKLPQHRCDAVTPTGACDQAGGSVLHRLQASKWSVADAE